MEIVLDSVSSVVYDRATQSFAARMEDFILSPRECPRKLGLLVGLWIDLCTRNLGNEA